MLRITDARTGGPIEVRRGLTRVQAQVPGSDTTSLRVLLVADVLARALELSGTPVFTVAAPPPELRERADALGIHPAEPTATGGGQVLHVTGPDVPSPSGIHVEVAPASAPAGPATPLRLALLAHPRHSPVDLDAPALAEAEETLARWRKAVATWATRPSRPIPEAVHQDLRAAWEDDLDIPAVLAVLRRVESAGDLPDGARFETYAYADRLLGLDLTRDIGTVT
ncbi:hypothetical protein [Streptomyces sp. NPDC002845]